MQYMHIPEQRFNFALVEPKHSAGGAQVGIHLRRAFTLVELSIVLVILGLLVGGVLAGQSLIRAAELRSVNAQQAQFAAAIYSFRDKYFALPGDMTNATAFWSTTTNGNGDGYMLPCGAPPASETFRAWQQLAFAGLIEGSYSGTATTSVGNPCHGNSVAATNVPRGKISNSAWSLITFSQSSGTNYEMGYTDLAHAYFNWLIVGGQNSDGMPIVPIFKPEEAWNIDTKADDGRPGSGKVRAGNGGAGGAAACQSATTAAAASYNLSLTTNLCYLGYIVN